MVLLFGAGALASAINAVAGGGTLITFPLLTGVVGLPTTVANATNSVALWPGSLGSIFGFSNLIHKTKHHLKLLVWPTFFGALSGAQLFVMTDQRTFDLLVPALILLASVLLLLQGKVKAWVQRDDRELHPYVGMTVQFFVALYGGYFGAGMGIMMLAAFALYMEGTLHELNAVKTWLGLVINFVASFLFIFQGLIEVQAAIALALGSIVGGFYAAKLSQKVNPEKLRYVIAAYGIAMALYFATKAV